MRSVFCLFAVFGAIQSAAAQQCDPTYPNACVRLTASVDASAIVRNGADIGDFAVVGPNVEVGAGVIGVRATLTGRVSGAAIQPFGDNAILSRGAFIGADADISDDVVIGRNVLTGRGLVAGTTATVGYASVLGDDVLLGAGATVGNLSTVGNRTTITGVVGRGVTIGDDVDVDGIVGPDVQIGDGAVVDGRVRKDAVIGASTVVDAGARIGRGASIGMGAILGNNVIVGTNATVPDCALLAGPEHVGNGQTWSGTTFVTGCGPSAVTPDLFEVSSAGNVTINDTKYDAVGNLYVAASVFGTAVYDGVSVATSLPGVSAGLALKFDPNMNLVWAQTLTGTGTTQLDGIALTGGDVYVTGSFSGTLTAGGNTLTAQSSANWLVGKLSASTAAVQWVESGTTTGFAYARMAVADATGVTVAGTYTRTPSFGPAVTLPSTFTNDYDVALVRYNAAGSPQWARRAGKSSSDSVSQLAALPNGNVAVGLFLSGGVKAAGSAFAPSPSTCVTCGMLAIVDPLGATVATHTLTPSSGTATVRGVTQENGRIFVSASATGSLPFALQTLPGAPGGDGEVHILEYSSLAVPVQAWSASTTSGWSLVHDLNVADGVVYGAAQVSGTTAFGSSTIAHPANGGNIVDTFGLVALDVDAGVWEWARTARVEAPANGFVFGRSQALSVFDDGIQRQLTYSLSNQGMQAFEFNGVQVPWPNPNADVFIRSGDGPTWAPN